MGDKGKEHQNYRDFRGYIRIVLGSILGLYRDSGKENESYYVIYRDYRGYMR